MSERTCAVPQRPANRNKKIAQTRDATILQYIDKIRYIAISVAAIQYNTPYKNIDILLIAIYCNIYCLQSCKYPIITLHK